MKDELRSALASELGLGPDPARGEASSVRVDLDALARLVRRAVSDAESGSAAPAMPGHTLAWEVEARLAASLDTYRRIESLRERLAELRAEIHDELSRVRATLVARRGFVESQHKPSAWPVDPERWHTLRLRVHARLAEFAERTGPDAPPARIVATDLLELFAKERAASLAEMRRHADAEISQLERRIAALDATLEEAEELFGILRELPQADGGLASGHRASSGLDAEARYREAKTAALDEIYRANLRIQGREDGEG